eukprot:TRINITY_DN2250_c0_g1_i1.p1 TRINITY_DN2250_c0_g1~~TRINITY_DN2250_c0_g1_i1.p1  ORF type:complete len:614 (+),score=180.64 TRINITY_DN2250_c0_g1_i1:35-1843(+)
MIEYYYCVEAEEKQRYDQLHEMKRRTFQLNNFSLQKLEKRYQKSLKTLIQDLEDSIVFMDINEYKDFKKNISLVKNEYLLIKIRKTEYFLKKLKDDYKLKYRIIENIENIENPNVNFKKAGEVNYSDTQTTLKVLRDKKFPEGIITGENQLNSEKFHFFFTFESKMDGKTRRRYLNNSDLNKAATEVFRSPTIPEDAALNIEKVEEKTERENFIKTTSGHIEKKNISVTVDTIIKMNAKEKQKKNFDLKHVVNSVKKNIDCETNEFCSTEGKKELLNINNFDDRWENYSNMYADEPYVGTVQNERNFGLKNFGNSCYLNVVLQLLFHANLKSLILEDLEMLKAVPTSIEDYTKLLDRVEKMECDFKDIDTTKKLEFKRFILLILYALQEKGKIKELVKYKHMTKLVEILGFTPGRMEDSNEAMLKLLSLLDIEETVLSFTHAFETTWHYNYICECGFEKSKAENLFFGMIKENFDGHNAKDVVKRALKHYFHEISCENEEGLNHNVEVKENFEGGKILWLQVHNDYENNNINFVEEFLLDAQKYVLRGMIMWNNAHYTTICREDIDTSSWLLFNDSSIENVDFNMLNGKISHITTLIYIKEE